MRFKHLASLAPQAIEALWEFRPLCGQSPHLFPLPQQGGLHVEQYDALCHVPHGVSRATLKGLTPYEFIVKAWTKEPERFTLNPLQQMPGLNN